MGTRRPEPRRRARLLREQGWALRPIANEVGAALSTVSLWVRDIPGPLVAVALSDHVEVGSSSEAQACTETRRCGKCGLDLPMTTFNRHPTGYQWWCRDCYRAYFRARSQQHRRDVRAARTMRRRTARSFVAEYLTDQSCSDCGEADSQVLEFHHLHGKRGNIADLVRRGSSVPALQRELANCTVVCGNCHRIRTAAAAGSWRLEPEQLEVERRLSRPERRNLAYVRDVLANSHCVDCGDSRLIVLEFDHVEKKNANVVELARRGCALWRLEAEVSRCEVRCVNCHRRRTHALATERSTGDEQRAP